MNSRIEPVFIDIETTGFNPMLEPWYNDTASEVTAVAVGHFPGWEDGDRGAEIDVLLNKGDMEYELLQNVRKKFGELRDQGLSGLFRVGWNIKTFDDPYLAARCGRLNQDPANILKWKRLDMMRALKIPKMWWDRNYHEGKNPSIPKQDDFARYMNIEFNDELDGSMMPGLYEDGEYDKIQVHVRDDMEVMMEIFKGNETKLPKFFVGHYKELEPGMVGLK